MTGFVICGDVRQRNSALWVVWDATEMPRLRRWERQKSELTGTGKREAMKETEI